MTTLGRLSKRSDFSALTQAQQFVTDYCSIRYRPTQGSVRIACVLRKKYFKNATDRNRLKRILKETYRSSGGCHRGVDLLVIFRPNCAKLRTFQQTPIFKQQWLDFYQHLDNSLEDSSACINGS